MSTLTPWTREFLQSLSTLPTDQVEDKVARTLVEPYPCDITFNNQVVVRVLVTDMIGGSRYQLNPTKSLFHYTTQLHLLGHTLERHCIGYSHDIARFFERILLSAELLPKKGYQLYLKEDQLVVLTPRRTVECHFIPPVTSIHC